MVISNNMVNRKKYKENNDQNVLKMKEILKNCDHLKNKNKIVVN